MEEIDRFEVISLSLNVYSYIEDFKTDNVLNIYDSCDLLNQQDKRIKKLETCLDEEIESNVNLYNLQSKTEKENQQLKKQLHDLPKKIVEDIKQQVFNHFKVKNIEEYEKLPLIDGLFTADTVIEILEAILKQYGGEDE